MLGLVVFLVSGRNTINSSKNPFIDFFQRRDNLEINFITYVRGLTFKMLELKIAFWSSTGGFDTCICSFQNKSKSKST
jgi:hypothetical protein